MTNQDIANFVTFIVVVFGFIAAMATGYKLGYNDALRKLESKNERPN